MRKRLYLDSIEDNLAKEMWGEFINKVKFFPGLTYYQCEFYEGFICNDKHFNINGELKKKLNPMTIIEVYTYQNERFILERTDREERVPKKLEKKYANRRYDESIHIYAFTQDSMQLLKYYHREIIKYIYNHQLETTVHDYKSSSGYVNKEIREIKRYLSLNAPEFIKKKDRQQAKAYLKKIYDKKLNTLNNKGLSDEDIELIDDRLKQKIEALSS